MQQLCFSVRLHNDTLFTTFCRMSEVHYMYFFFFSCKSFSDVISDGFASAFSCRGT